MMINLGMKRLMCYTLLALFFGFGSIILHFVFRDLIVTGLVIILCSFPSAIIVKSFLSSPWFRIEDGESYLCYVFDSTGPMIPYDIKMPKKPFLSLSLPGNKQAIGIFERELVTYIEPPRKGSGDFVKKEGTLQFDVSRGDLLLHIPKSDIPKYGFAHQARPAFLFNEKAGQFVSKEMLSQLEYQMVLKNASNVILEMMRAFRYDISTIVKHYIDQFKSNKWSEFLSSKWMPIILAIIFIIIILAVFGPNLGPILDSFLNSFTGSVSSVGNSLDVTAGKPTIPV